MKINNTALGLLALLMGFTATAQAANSGTTTSDMVTQTGVIATNIAIGLQETQNNQIDKIATQFSSIRSALVDYYTATSGWPASLQSMQSLGYYTGTYVTGLGTIAGALGGSSQYVLTLTLPVGTQANIMAKSIAAKVSGTATNNVVRLAVSTPSASAIVKNMLSRVPDAANPNNNRMMQNINMNSFSLQSVNQIDATRINVQDIAASRNVTIGNNLTVAGTTTLNGSVTVNNTINASRYVTNGHTLSDTSGALFYKDQDLDARYLNKNGTAVNADNLDGIDSSSFARLNNGSQLFAGDVIARSGATQYSLIGAYNRISSLESQMNNANNRLNNHESRISNLEAWRNTCASNLAACGNASTISSGGVDSVAYAYNGTLRYGQSITLSRPAIVRISGSVSAHSSTNYSSGYTQGSVSGAALYYLSNECNVATLDSFTISTAAQTTSTASIKTTYDTCILPAGYYVLREASNKTGDTSKSLKVTAMYLN